MGDIVDVYDGVHQTPDYKSSGVMFLSVENIKTLSSNKYISKSAFDRDFKVKPRKNDVLMTRIGDVGTANIIRNDQPIAYYVSLALLRSKILNPRFLMNVINSYTVQNEIWRRTLHVAFPKKINKNEISKINVLYPKIAEQKKIGQFLKSIDSLIAANQRQQKSHGFVVLHDSLVLSYIKLAKCFITLSLSWFSSS